MFEFLSPLFALLGLVVSVGLWAFGAVSTGYIVSFLVVSVGMGVVLSTAALAIDQVGYGRYERRRDVGRLLAYTVLESIGFHQLHNVWRFVGYVDIAPRQDRLGCAEASRAGPADGRGPVTGYLIAPWVTPDITQRWVNRYTTIAGVMAMR